MEMQLRARPRSHPVTLETRAGYVAMASQGKTVFKVTLEKTTAMILDINECVEEGTVVPYNRMGVG